MKSPDNISEQTKKETLHYLLSNATVCREVKQHSGIWVTLDLNSPMQILNLLSSDNKKDWVSAETELGEGDNRWLDKGLSSGQSELHHMVGMFQNRNNQQSTNLLS